jgi:uncharacterized membrane protein
MAYWWTLIPGFGYFAMWRQLHAVRGRLAVLLLAMLVLAELLALAGNWVTLFFVSALAFLVASAILAVYAYSVQSGVNSYLAAAHPDAGPAPVTAGEVVAAALGGIAFVAVPAAIGYLSFVA